MVAFGNKEHTKEQKMDACLIKALHIEQCSLRGCISPPPPPRPPPPPPKRQLEFQSNQNGSNDTKGNENIICTILKYGEMFYGRSGT